MGYQIEYNMQSIKFKKINKKNKSLRYIIILGALVIGAIGLHFGSAVLESIIFGRGKAVSTAAEEMVERIQEGASLAEAVRVFCSEVEG